MKLDIQRFNKINLNINLLLTVALLLILAYEVLLIYKFIYNNLYVDPNQIIPSNIVRVDLQSYQNTIDYLDDQKTFTAPVLNLERSNPFRP